MPACCWRCGNPDQSPAGWPASVILLAGAAAGAGGLSDDRCAQPARHAHCQPQSDTPAIALIGDSHAAALAANVADDARRQQKPLFQLTKASCPFLLDATRAIPQKPQHAQQCLDFNQRVLPIILSDKIDEVVISAFWAAGLSEQPGSGFRSLRDPAQDNLQALKSDLDTVVAQLLAAGKKITLIDDVPTITLDPLRYSHNRNMPLRRTLNSWLSAQDGAALAAERTQQLQMPNASVADLLKYYQQRGVRVLSLQETLCNAQGCLVTHQGMPLWYDNNHLNPYGGEMALGKNW